MVITADEPKRDVLVIYEPPPPIHWRWRVLALLTAFVAGLLLGR